MTHDTTSDETTEELNAGCGGLTEPHYLSMCTIPNKGFWNLF